MKLLKGQGSTEYLVLFAVVLVIVMVVVALLGLFPSMGSGVSSGASSAYWSSTRPVQIADWSSQYALPYAARLSLKNVAGSKITITNVELSDRSDMGTPVGNTTVLTMPNSGDTATAIVTLPAATNWGCAALGSGKAYSYYVKFTYNTAATTGLTFIGAQPITGTCT